MFIALHTADQAYILSHNKAVQGLACRIKQWK